MVRLLAICLLLTACDKTAECYEPDRPWNYFDSCASYPGTPQYKQSHPAPCPWLEVNGKCCPPSGCGQ